ncbi:ac78 [Psilogramma increta granulovirus]|uniref:Ac78 n=1 Tax=Psilogramma increta granulovirus TaxID=2953508 RepID=A0A977XVK7_9BBAC|nr:ac78 [Psilogramma increta granulovirus]
MIQRSVVDISTISNTVVVEPIPLKLSHNNHKNNEKDTNTTPIINTENESSSFMWFLLVSFVLIFIIILLVSYFIINHVNGQYTGSTDDYHDENYGELQYLEIGSD